MQKFQTAKTRTSQVITERHGAQLIRCDSAKIHCMLRHDGEQLLTHLASHVIKLFSFVTDGAAK